MFSSPFPVSTENENRNGQTKQAFRFLKSESKRSSYGEYSAGLSSMLFNRGSRCGGCFEVRCVDHIKWCLMRSPSVILTTTDFCPLSAELRASGRLRRLVQLSPSTFSLSEAAFAQIAHRGANIVPVQYLR
ncbi:unnamed protein product [Thlaspi arvense]|uniref:Expansin n=1 Tax=Thlaspi arvense TaxID=13288 RepID=A0AAU9S2Q2_THLAR|nr:unnamed protein product [Thlaspi arvense]